MLQMRQAVVVDAHRTGGTRLRSADVLLRILRSQRDRHREHLKTLPASAECVFTSASRGIVVRANLKGGMARAHRADARRCCAVDPATLLHLIACLMGAGAPRDRAPRRDRACQTGIQGSADDRGRAVGLASQDS
jgi:hypothetical protein